MASVILGAAASAAVGSIGLTGIGATLAAVGAKAAAGVIGAGIDNALFGASSGRAREGARLADLLVQTSTYGKMIPLVYGNARIAGNVIWSRPIKELAITTTTSQGGKGGGGGVSSSSTEFSYYVTLAIAVCEGPVSEIQRVWADAKLLDVSRGTYRFYKGDELQLPDALIESFEGVGKTPAYRGLSYVVIEDFPLADFGNRIPNFTFEVNKKILWPDVDGESIENLIEEMVLIPGSGEFVYDTTIQKKIEGEYVSTNFVERGEHVYLNVHTPKGTANALVALDQLKDTCPNVSWVSVVVSWFGNDMDAGNCVLKPGVEFPSDAAITSPEAWSVGSFSRGSARQITYVENSPRYGGTPDDQSLLRLLDELKARGYKIFFYPLFLMDVADKPWRGRVTGSAANVASFFTKTNGYNAFISHYANLVASRVDAFAIGSELKALTAVHNGATSNRQFPAVNALVSLAATVKSIVGSGVKVTYAADWSEYHHTDDGWYHLDPLWASPNVDVVGIDAYFPLTDAPQSQVGYDANIIKQGWTSGEGFDWYYTDVARTTTATLAPAYAWKNIDWWWKNSHVNPDGVTTNWVAQSKKIWFTEYGFPSIDGATNQPNVFYDPTSSESFFPYHSRGRIDFRAQRAVIAATLAQWRDSGMVERTFLWTWDARPYPYWPDLLDVWADGGVWKTGHWVQGKFGLSALAAIVADLCQRAGLALGLVDVSRLRDQVEGYVVSSQSTARSLIEQLMAGFFFDAVESQGALKFIPRGNATIATISTQDLLPVNADSAQVLRITRAQELELPRRVQVNYINRLAMYQPGLQSSARQTGDASDTQSLNLPIVMADKRAKSIADVLLYQSWLARTGLECELSMAYGDLEPADVIEVQSQSANHVMRITQTRFDRSGKIRVIAAAEEVSSYDVYAPPAASPIVISQVPNVTNSVLEFLDVPALSTDNAADAYLRFAALGSGAAWDGAVVYRSDDGAQSFQQLVSFKDPCVVGVMLTALASGTTTVFDEVSFVEVSLKGSGVLASASLLAVLNGANLMLVGNELIQFMNATELSEGKYRLSGLLRGRLGTEWAVAGHGALERVVLLDSRLQKDAVADGLIGLGRDYKAVTIGQTLGQVTAQNFTYAARALKPYAPVHASAVRDGSGNIALGWVRRTRVGGQWKDGTDVPLSESSERYEIDVMNGANVVRTLSAISPSAAYGASQQVADFGSVQASVTVRIYQMSDRIGRGYGLEAVV